MSDKNKSKNNFNLNKEKNNLNDKNNNYYDLNKIVKYFETLENEIKFNECYLAYLVWKFHFLSWNNIKDLFLRIENKQSKYLPKLLKTCIEKNYIKKVVYGNTKFYLPRKKTFMLLKATYYCDKVNWLLINHQDLVYKLVRKNNWKVYLSEREMVKIMSYETYTNFYPHLTDLVLIENNNKIGIEIEMNLKPLTSEGKVGKGIIIFYKLIEALKVNEYKKILVFTPKNVVFNRWVQYVNGYKNNELSLFDNKIEYEKGFEPINNKLDLKEKFEIYLLNDKQENIKTFIS